MTQIFQKIFRKIFRRKIKKCSIDSEAAPEEIPEKIVGKVKDKELISPLTPEKFYEEKVDVPAQKQTVSVGFGEDENILLYLGLFSLPLPSTLSYFHITSNKEIYDHKKDKAPGNYLYTSDGTYVIPVQYTILIPVIILYLYSESP
ncbi:hypothetical protein XENTR_v10017693 [Xenopus tropicalis]|uniref:Uncharacterized protein n=1 Tax=Xenopus tropicalis TaxID=8364 RepID=A0A1B8Y576_XENTR|nr:hypothetical protein XENTR_v10017693 [Xenopus tropicalis]